MANSRKKMKIDLLSTYSSFLILLCYVSYLLARNGAQPSDQAQQLQQSRTPVGNLHVGKTCAERSEEHF